MLQFGSDGERRGFSTKRRSKMSEEGIPLEVVDSNGDPGGSRTPNPQIRSLMLYPVELRGQHFGTFVGN